VSTSTVDGSRGRNVALAVPLILVNTSAILGQAMWAKDHLVPAWMQGHPAAVIALCVLFALTVESIAVYLAYEAHAAAMEGQAYGTLRLASYTVASVAGVMNYLHFAGKDHAPTPLAVTFGLLSSMSPWLWGIRSRSMHRVVLTEKGLIDPRSVRFTLAQRLLYPFATFGAYRLAVWNGVNNPAQARADFTDRQAAKKLADKSDAGPNRRALPPVKVAFLPPPLADSADAGDDLGELDDVGTQNEAQPKLSPAAERIARVRSRQPALTQQETAQRAGVHINTVKSWWAHTTPPVPAAEPINGHTPELEGARG
jgi:hypothetical protein